MSVDNNIPNGWEETPIGNVVELAQGVAINKKTDFILCDESKGVPLLKINNLLNNTVDQYVDLNLVPQKTILEKDDIVFTRTGQVGWVFTNKFGVLHNNSFKVIPNDNLNKKFIYWFLKQKHIFNYVQKVASGSAQPDLNHGAFKTIEILFPSNIEEQKAIANILTAFNNKIENLQDQNKTLETTAQTIFKEWFGKHQIGDELPNGWIVGELRNLTERISKGTTPKKKDLKGLKTEIPFLKVKDISKQGLVKKDNLELIPKGIHENQLKRSILETDDILFSIAGTIGRVTIVDKELNASNCNQAIAFIRLKDKIKFKEYVHLWIKSKEIQAQINNSIVQGVQANVSLTVLGNLSINIPDASKMNEWKKLINPIYSKLENNVSQIQTLKKTRDTLLPKLMNGQLRIDDFKE